MHCFKIKGPNRLEKDNEDFLAKNIFPKKFMRRNNFIGKSTQTSNGDVVQTNAINARGDFENLVTTSGIFVDKVYLYVKSYTKVLKEFLLQCKYSGKSLNLDMLRRFLSIEIDEQTGAIAPNNQTNNYKSFTNGNLKISYDQHCMGLQGQYPVIFINFNVCKGLKTYTEIEKILRKIIIELYLHFGYLGKSNKNYTVTLTIKERYESLLNEIRNGNDVVCTIKDLCRLLYSYHKKEVWILIDDYDTIADAYITMNETETDGLAFLFQS
eukprot:gene1963-3813_t